MSQMPAELYYYLSFLVFVVGACVGSFLNVCIYRLPREESVITPRSHCPKCGSMVAWYDNIPLLSYLILRGRCRYCGQTIAFRYFVVELLTALLFLMIWLIYKLSFLTVIYWVMTAGLIVGTFVDFEYMIIPDVVTLGGMVIGLLFSWLVPDLHDAATGWRGLLSGVIGMLLGAGILFSVGVIGSMVFKKEAMGFGDVKLLGAIGAFLGWQAVFFTILVSAFFGAIVGVSLVVVGQKQWQSKIPYGPYLALAAIIWIFIGEKLWLLYMDFMARGYGAF